MDDEIPGLDVGDLAEHLERVASECAADGIQADDQLQLRRAFTAGFCAHPRAAIDEGNRSLSCRQCGAPLDPFDFLLRLATSTERWISARKDIERRTHKAEATLQRLLADERNTRARLRTLNRKLK